MSTVHRPLWWFALVSLMTFVLVGCSKDSPTQPGGSTVSLTDADDVSVMVGMSLSRGLVGDPATAGAPGSALASARQATTDTTIVTPFVTWSLSRTFYSALGAVQPTYDPVTTVRMTAAARGVGAVRTLTDTVTFGSAAALDVRGLALAQDTLVCNGTRQDTLLASFQSPMHNMRMHHYLEGQETRVGVRHLKPVNLHPWPLSGTATWTLSVDKLRTGDRGSVERHYTCTAVVVFNGTRNVSLTVDGMHRYTLDLLTGAVVRA